MHESGRDMWLGIILVVILVVAATFLGRHLKKENERKALWNKEASALMRSVTNSGAFTWDELHIESSNGHPVLVGTKVKKAGE